MNKELLTIAIVATIAIVTMFDFIIFTLKSAPKKSIFPNFVWHIGFACLAILIYYYLNGYKL